jgi:hypothetical protein
MGYVFLSSVCHICDFSLFVITLNRFGNVGNEDSEIFLIILIIIYSCCSLSWAGLLL